MVPFRKDRGGSERYFIYQYIRLKQNIVKFETFHEHTKNK